MLDVVAASDAPQTPVRWRGTRCRKRACTPTTRRRRRQGRADPGGRGVDGIDEFLQVTFGRSGPGRTARRGWRSSASEGPSWILDLTPAGAKLDPAASGEPSTTVGGSASDILLALFGRVPLDRLRIEGDATVLRELRGWGDAS